MLNAILIIFQEKITHFFFLEKNKVIHVLGEGKIFRRQPNTIHFVMKFIFFIRKHKIRKNRKSKYIKTRL